MAHLVDAAGLPGIRLRSTPSPFRRTNLGSHATHRTSTESASLVVSGYGFTAEKDYLYIIEGRSGEELFELPIKSGHDWIRWVDDKLVIKTYGYDYGVKLESP